MKRLATPLFTRVNNCKHRRFAKAGCAEPNPIPYNIAAIITPVKPFERVNTTIAKNSNA